VPSTNDEHSLARRLPYHQVVCSILYSSKGTRHDLVHPAGVLSRFISKWRQVDGLALEGSKASRTLHSRDDQPLSHLRWRLRKADHPCDMARQTGHRPRPCPVTQLPSSAHGGPTAGTTLICGWPHSPSTALSFLSYSPYSLG
jgi:hypothetical protein